MAKMIKDQQQEQPRGSRRRVKPSLQECLMRQEGDSFVVDLINDELGYGVFTKRKFDKGDFLLEYKGEFITNSEADDRSRKYEIEGKGCFIYHNVKDVLGKVKCIDATTVEGFGKMVNDSPAIHANSHMKREVLGKNVHLCLFAITDISEGTEIRYDYRDIPENMPWRLKESCLKPRIHINIEEDTDYQEIDFHIQFKTDPADRTGCSSGIDGQRITELICLNMEQLIAVKDYKSSICNSQANYIEVKKEHLDTNDSKEEALGLQSTPLKEDTQLPDLARQANDIEIDNNTLEVNDSNEEALGLQSTPLKEDTQLHDLARQANDMVIDNETLEVNDSKEEALGLQSTPLKEDTQLPDLSRQGNDMEIGNETLEVNCSKEEALGLQSTPLKEDTQLPDMVCESPEAKKILSEIEILPSSIPKIQLSKIETNLDLEVKKGKEAMKDLKKKNMLFPEHQEERACYNLIHNKRTRDLPVINYSNQLNMDGDGCEDPEFLPSDFEEDKTDPDVKLEEAISKINALCAKFEVQEEERSFHELLNLNDSGLVLSASVGEIIDTDNEENNGGNSADENNDRKGVDDSNGIKNKRKKKPNIHRPCPYCFKMQSALTRHMSTKHKLEPAVASALSKPPVERRKAFDNLKKQGIFQFNQNEMKKENPVYMRERHNENDENEVVICSECKGAFSKKYKPRHQIQCGKSDGQIMIPMIPMQDMIVTTFSNDFKAVLNKMIIDEISSTAKTDPIILVIGVRIYNGSKSKEEKLCEVEKRVRQTMRLLSRLYLKFKESLDLLSVDSSDMFDKKNLRHLRFAIDSLCSNDVTTKNGLKLQIQNTLKSSGKILEAHFLVEGKDEKAVMVCEFLKVFGLVEDEIFNGALYQIKQKRNKSTRKPANLPDDNLLDELKSYLNKVTSKEYFILEQPDDVFTTVRDAVCARLVIYNGRRGGEPARLYVYQWQEALDGTWIRPQVREQYKNEIETGNRITFQEGKGDRQVPVFFPPYLVSALTYLCSSHVRSDANVSSKNNYVFPSTKQSENHVNGWHALANCIEKAGLGSKLNGTMNRHRVISIIGSLNLSEECQNLAYDHFGHSKDVNRNIYQIPQAERQLATTGKILGLIDQNKQSSLLPSNNESQLTSSSSSICLIDENKLSSLPPRNEKRKFSSPLISSSSTTVELIEEDKLSSLPSTNEERNLASCTVSESLVTKKSTSISGLNGESSGNFEASSNDDDNRLKVRKSFRWSKNLIKKFNKDFYGYVERTEKTPMPSQAEMKRFLKDIGEDSSNFNVVRTRINNERLKLKKRIKDRKGLLGI